LLFISSYVPTKDAWVLVKIKYKKKRKKEREKNRKKEEKKKYRAQVFFKVQKREVSPLGAKIRFPPCFHPHHVTPFITIVPPYMHHHIHTHSTI
jgi:hypothetical protein